MFSVTDFEAKWTTLARTQRFLRLRTEGLLGDIATVQADVSRQKDLTAEKQLIIDSLVSDSKDKATEINCLRESVDELQTRIGNDMSNELHFLREEAIDLRKRLDISYTVNRELSTNNDEKVKSLAVQIRDRDMELGNARAQYDRDMDAQSAELRRLTKIIEQKNSDIAFGREAVVQALAEVQANAATASAPLPLPVSEDPEFIQLRASYEELQEMLRAINGEREELLGLQESAQFTISSLRGECANHVARLSAETDKAAALTSELAVKEATVRSLSRDVTMLRDKLKDSDALVSELYGGQDDSYNGEDDSFGIVGGSDEGGTSQGDDSHFARAQSPPPRRESANSPLFCFSPPQRVGTSRTNNLSPSQDVSFETRFPPPHSQGFVFPPSVPMYQFGDSFVPASNTRSDYFTQSAPQPAPSFSSQPVNPWSNAAPPWQGTMSSRSSNPPGAAGSCAQFTHGSSKETPFGTFSSNSNAVPPWQGTMSSRSSNPPGSAGSYAHFTHGSSKETPFGTFSSGSYAQSAHLSSKPSPFGPLGSSSSVQPVHGWSKPDSFGPFGPSSYVQPVQSSSNPVTFAPTPRQTNLVMQSDFS